MKPTYVIGDFDSVRPEVLQHYQDMGTIIHKDESQDTTDMEKCLNFLMKVLGTDFKSTNLSPHIVIVYGAFGGRID